MVVAGFVVFIVVVVVVFVVVVVGNIINVDCALSGIDIFVVVVNIFL